MGCKCREKSKNFQNQLLQKKNEQIINKLKTEDPKLDKNNRISQEILKNSNLTPRQQRILARQERIKRRERRILLREKRKIAEELKKNNNEIKK